MLVQGPILQGEGSTVLVESHYTPSDALTTLELPLSSPFRIPTRQETKVPQLSSPTHTHVVDEAASTSVDVRHRGAATNVSSLDLRQGSGQKLGGRLEANKEGIWSCLYQAYHEDKEVRKICQVRRRAKIVAFDDEELEDPSKQGRSMIEEIDQDAKVHLVTPTQVLAEVAKVHTYTKRRRTISTASGGISTAEESVSTAGASMPVSTAGMVDKGKAIMKESEPELTTTKLQQRQERAGYEVVVRLQEQLDEEERQRIARVHEEASSFNVEEWEYI
nr:hypothetical protein [Tanacetum cinerariifolium]